MAADYYSTYMNGAYCEMRVKNNLALNDKKLLIVGDSYARPFGAFMSLCFSDTRVLDVQKGRYNNSLFAYINEFNPDAVISLFSDAELNYPEAFEFGLNSVEWREAAEAHMSAYAEDTYFRWLYSLMEGR
jgi:hypothetical protein